MTDPAVPPPAPQYAAAPVVPGRGLGIAGLIFAFVFAPLGLILSIVAKVQSNKAGAKNGLATAGIIISIIAIVFYVILFIILGVTAAALVSQCAQLGSGVHDTGNGVVVTCG